MDAAEGVEEASGRARFDNGADELLPPTLNDGAISGTGCADVSCAILEVPEAFSVATAVVFSAGAGFSAGAEFFSETAFTTGFFVSISATGFALVGAGVAGCAFGDPGWVLAEGGIGTSTLAASCVCCGAFAPGFCIFRKAKVAPAAITNTATTPIIMNRLPGFLSSDATASNVPKLAFGATSARFSSFFVGGVANGTTSSGMLLMGSTLATAGAAARGAEVEGLITTAGGAGAGAAAITGLAVIAGGAGRGSSECGFSSRARRSFCSSAEIWSAMVFNTATCVMVKACGVGANAARTPTTRLSSRTGVTTMERMPRARIAAVSTRVSVSQSSQRSSLPLWMQSPVKVPSTRSVAPTSGALAPLRARQTISAALPSLSAMATPDALVKAWARCATTARSSGEAPRAFLLAGLLAVSEAWVAMLIAVPQKLNFGSCLPGPRRETSSCQNASYGTR